jgi:hypothetical protein
MSPALTERNEAMTINNARPVEELVGSNYGIVRMRLGNIHCCESLLTQARHARPKGMRSVPVALRRGWVKCVLETVAENRGLYRSVMYGA